MQAVREYVGNIKRSAATILDGMAVTFSFTCSRPDHDAVSDRTSPADPRPHPDRYRGFLWVDMDICISCRLCERACPIDCIRIEDVKIDRILVPSALDGKPTPKVKDPTLFDINLYKCMYCALCVEPCPTGAIMFTKQFEGSTPNLADLHLRLISPERKEQVLVAAAEYERKDAAKKAAKAAAATAPAAATPPTAPAAAPDSPRLSLRSREA